MAPMDEKDREIRDQIFISLVRIAQKGNVLAQQYIIEWITFIVNEWIEKLWFIAKWKGYTDDIEKMIRACIRCYRYTGTFVGYVFKTFQYSARGLKPLHAYSFNDRVRNGNKTRIDYFIAH